MNKRFSTFTLVLNSQFYVDDLQIDLVRVFEQFGEERVPVANRLFILQSSFHRPGVFDDHRPYFRSPDPQIVSTPFSMFFTVRLIFL
jgi:hypothetical protein